MPDLTLVTLTFDDSRGPAVKSIHGPLVFSESARRSIEVCAFPESAVPLQSKMHVYSFVVNSFYCHCAYIRKSSTRSPRGYLLFAFVFVTEMGFLEPVFDLLVSMHVILSHRYSEIVQLMVGMFKIWVQLLDDISEKVCDLPLFDGPATYGSSSPNHLHVLDVVECEADLQNVWMSLVLGTPVVVCGATPAITSRVVLELAWLVQRFATPELIPYIPVTDPRFADLVKKPRGIVGVSNPVACALLAPGSAVVRVGFPRTSFRFPFTGRANSRSKLIGILRNTERLADAVRVALPAMAEKDPNGFARGEVRIAVLVRAIIETGVETAMATAEFAARLANAPVFKEKFRDFKRR
jgi:hypothetical protein